MWLASVPAALFGDLVGSNFFQISTNIGTRMPDVAYDSVDGKYLVVWMDYRFSPPQIWGRLVTGNGTVSGTDFRISDATGGYYPAIAYNATNNEFLVTWDDQRPGYHIYAQRVRGSDGVLLGGNFSAGTLAGNRSAVAWSATSNNYLVAFAVVDGSVLPTDQQSRPVAGRFSQSLQRPRPVLRLSGRHLGRHWQPVPGHMGQRRRPSRSAR